VPRVLFTIAGIVVGVSLCATLAWALMTMGPRPLDGVEGDVLFEADRIHAGYALWIDPSLGAHEYGEPPARYLVLYPPLWSAVLSFFRSAVVARLISFVAWLFVLAWPVIKAAPERRNVASAVALLAMSIWVLMLYGASGRPDSIAVLFAGIALERSARKGDVDWIAGALFALAAWTKPNVIGAAPGAMIAAFIATRRLRGIGGALAASAVIAGILTIASHGKWVEHLLLSTGQSPSAELFVDQLVNRAPFFVLPIGLALFSGWKRAPIAFAALATSTAWSLLCLAKIGSATNYFMEPMVCAVVVFARADLRVARGPLLGVLCIVQSLWTGIASVKASVREITFAFERRMLLGVVRASCKGPVLADEPGLELQLNGRIIQTPFQSTHRSAFSRDQWVADVNESECLVMQDDLLERPLDEVSVPHDRFDPVLRRALRERFRLDVVRTGWHVYRAKEPGP